MLRQKEMSKDVEPLMFIAPLQVMQSEVGPADGGDDVGTCKVCM